MVKYENGKIYRLVCNITGVQYIGSTCSTLSHRKNQHKVNYSRWLAGEATHVTSFEIIKNGNYDIVLIEAYPCNTKEELYQRERHYIETLKCINKQLPTQNRKEWYSKNKDKLKEYNKDWRIKNIDDVKQREKEYRVENSDKIRDKKRETYMCECGNNFTKQHKARHMKTKTHLDFIQSKTLQ